MNPEKAAVPSPDKERNVAEGQHQSAINYGFMVTFGPAAQFLCSFV